MEHLQKPPVMIFIEENFAKVKFGVSEREHHFTMVSTFIWL